MSGPSTLATTDLGQNKHVWIQGGIRHRMRIHNPTTSPIKVEIFKISLKCDDAGATPGTFNEAAGPPNLPFATGSAFAAANLPSAAYWEFWDQASRQAMTASGSVTAASWVNDTILSLNTNGTYQAPVGGNIGGQRWEVGPDDQNGMRWDERTSLSFIFPNLKRKARIRRVVNAVIKPYETAQRTFRASAPSELRPRDYISNSKTNFSKHSYFLFVKARALGPVILQSRETGSSCVNYLSPWNEPITQLIIHDCRDFQIRRSGDSFPTFGRQQVDSAAWLNTTAAGILETGSPTVVVDQTNACVKKFAEQHSIVTSGGNIDIATAYTPGRVYKLN